MFLRNNHNHSFLYNSCIHIIRQNVYQLFELNVSIFINIIWLENTNLKNYLMLILQYINFELKNMLRDILENCFGLVWYYKNFCNWKHCIFKTERQFENNQLYSRNSRVFFSAHSVYRSAFRAIRNVIWK